MRFQVNLNSKAYKQLGKLPQDVQAIAVKALKSLEQEGMRPKFWDVKKIADDSYRIRLNYRYRMRYTVVKRNLLITVFYIGHRKNAY